MQNFLNNYRVGQYSIEFSPPLLQEEWLKILLTHPVAKRKQKKFLIYSTNLLKGFVSYQRKFHFDMYLSKSAVKL